MSTAVPLLYHVYRASSQLSSPLVWAFLTYRRWLGKEDSDWSRFKERFGIPSIDRPGAKDAPLLWVHGASLGEILSALPLVHQFAAQNANWNVLLTTGTRSSSQLLRSRAEKGVICQYVPVDLPGSVNRFLTFWRPSAVVFIESELWPNLVFETHRRQIPLALINARISPRSAQRWASSYLKPLFQYLLSRFSMILASGQEDLQRLHAFNINWATYVGNLKTGVAEVPRSLMSTVELIRSRFRSRQVWMAASTHAGEEEIIIETHKELSKMFPNVLTIIAPRHPERKPQIEKLLHMNSMTFELHTEFKSSDSPCSSDVYILDTVGELPAFYSLVDIAFVGGSMVQQVGGHNPIEAAVRGCAVLVGPHAFNFSSLLQQLKEVNFLSWREVASAEDLARAVTLLWHNPALLQQRKEAANKAAQALSLGVTERILAQVSLLITPVEPHKSQGELKVEGLESV